MRTPEVSVVTPVYNAAPYIGEAIENILNQTFSDFEFIIIDDQSTDGSWDIIQRFGQKDSRIRAFRNEHNLGIAGNRNVGIEKVRGRYVAWQDADDVSIRTRLEKQHRFLKEHPDVGIVGGYLQFFNEQGDGRIRRYAMEDTALRRTIFRYSPVAQPAAMIRIEALREAGPYDLRWPPAEDIDMSFRIGTHYKFANIPEVMVRYRQHGASATFRKLRKIETSTLRIRYQYSKMPVYSPTFVDWIYNVLQFLSIYVVPPRLKITLFNYFRDV